MRVQVLGGEWELAPVPFSGVDPKTVTHWHTMEVPSHWQMHPELTDTAGFVLYRKRFAYKPKKSERVHLVFPGIFYYSTVFLNGRRLGDHEGYFTAQRYDVTDLIAKENEVIVEVNCPDEKERNNKRMITGVFSHWDCLDPTTNPGGIWLAPELHVSGNVWCDACLFQTDDLEDNDASITIRVELLAQQAGKVKVAIDLSPDNFKGRDYQFEHEVEIDEGRNKLAFSHRLPKPQLWWTHDRGKPNLYRLTMEFRQGRRLSDTYECPVGIRTVRFDDWLCSLNGERLYLRGSNQPPTDTRLATVTEADAERDVRLAIAANMNMLRVHAHVDHPALYDAADRLGLLLWQDFPLQWSYQRAVLPIAERMIQAMGRLLFNHPSIAVWCCHNEPIYLVETDDETPKEVAKTMFTLAIWGWNREVLDKALKEALEAVDSTRFVNKCSGELWLPWQKGTDTHFYFGWYRVQGKSMYQFNLIRKYLPNNLKFNTEFGAQSLPNLESCHKFMDEDIKRIDWQKLEDRHSLQKKLLDHWVGLAQPNLATLVEKSQAYQAELNRFYIDRFRLAKYQPNGGVLMFMFTDPNPAIQWSVLDYWRTPKKSYDALARAFRPVYAFVIMDQPVRQAKDRPLRLEAYLVNDTKEDLGEVPLTLTVTDARGRLVNRQQARPMVGPDSPAIQALVLEESPAEPGTYTVTVAIDRPDDHFENVYTFDVE